MGTVRMSACGLGLATVLATGACLLLTGQLQPEDANPPAPQVWPAHQGAATLPIPVPSSVTSSSTTPTPTQHPGASVAAQKPTRRPAPPTFRQPATWDEIFQVEAARLPGKWVVEDRGAWGATSLETGTVYISPRAPQRYLIAIMLHESMHVRQGQLYGGIYAARDGLAKYGGIEINADCGALILGANWTNYTQSCTPQQRAAAQSILKGIRP